MNDKTNALLSIDREHAARATTQIVEQCSGQLVYKYIMFSTFVLECPDKALCLLPRDGILPGSSLVVRVWVQALHPVIKGLAEKLAGADDMAPCTVVRAPTGEVVDVFFRIRG